MNSKGTYVALRVLPLVGRGVYEHCRNIGILGIGNPLEDRLHTTLLHSQVHCSDLVSAPRVVHHAKFKGYGIFKNRDDGNALVMLLDAPTVVARHHWLVHEYGAEYSYPTYTPHITLAYKFNRDHVDGIAPYLYPIRLGHEYTEDLDLDWT